MTDQAGMQAVQTFQTPATDTTFHKIFHISKQYHTQKIYQIWKLQLTVQESINEKITEQLQITQSTYTSITYEDALKKT